MTRLNCSRTLSLLCTLGLLGIGAANLAGCAIGAASFPDASINPQSAALGTIQGSDFGGHAPLIGAHVYVLQPNTTTYGGQATSLLTASYQNNGQSSSPVNYNATTKNASDPGIPTTWYYQTTDLTGRFNISGDYTCTVGVPVYLYLYGGSPTYPSTSNTFNVTNISSVGSTGEVTFTVSTIENAYVGEQVNFANLSGVNGFNAIEISTQTVDAVNLTTSTFSVNVGAGTTSTYNGGNDGGGTATFFPTNNPGVVNLAMLGNCPNGTTNVGFGSTIPYVYVNEVSTIAAAYALSPFTLPSNNNATYVGTDSGNIAGIQNTATIAKQLYDITGSQQTTVYAGEGHIANYQSINGNGIVPQANIDTLGNILAACVDSNNTGTMTLGSGGTQPSGMSAQCYGLFKNATNTGIPATSTGTGANAAGTAPIDTAQAAINIARHPAGPPYSYTGSTGTNAFVTALYTLPTGNVPFTPNLGSQPKDFTIAIDYPYGTSNPYSPAPESIAIDKIGNVWITSQAGSGSTQYFFELSPAGVASNVQSRTSGTYGYVTISSTETPLVGNDPGTGPITYVPTSTTPAATTGALPPTYTYGAGATNSTKNENFTYSSASDSSGNIYFGNNGTGGNSDYVLSFTSPTATGAETGTAMATVNSDNSGLSHAAMAAGGYIYFDYNASNGAGSPYITRVTASTGANTSGWPISNGATTGGAAGCNALTDPESMAVTASGDVIVSAYNNGNGAVNAASSSLYYITSAGTCTQLSGATLIAGLNSPFGAALDGNDYFYTSNRGGATISVLNTSGGTAASTVAVSPSNGYEPQYVSSGTLTDMLNQPLNLATGPSGEIWIADFYNGSVVEIVGLAAPTTTPLSVATAGTIGVKP